MTATLMPLGRRLVASLWDGAAGSVLRRAAYSSGVVRGINVTKEGSDPKALPDSEYPPWLFQMADKAPMRNADALNPADGRIYFKKSNLTKIRRNNFVRDKKR